MANLYLFSRFKRFYRSYQSNSQSNRFNRLKIFTLFNIFILGLVIIFPISGLSLETLGQFDIEIPVGNNVKLGPVGTTAAQNELIQQAFKEMLVRVTGKQKIVDSTSVHHALHRIDDYVRKFSYHQSTAGRMLRVQFNEILVRDLLNQANIKVLDKSSESIGPVLVWALISENNSQRWIGSEGEKAAAEELNRISKKLGLSVVFPLFDISDTTQVTEQNIVNREFDPIVEASKRYNASAILIGKLNKQNAGWYAEWTLLESDKNMISNETWDNSQTEFNSLISDSIEKLNEKISELNELKEKNNLQDDYHQYKDNISLEVEVEKEDKSARKYFRKRESIW